MLNELQAMGVQGGLLIGVANVTVIPHLSPGIAYAQAEQAGAFPPTFDVADNCATTGATALVPSRTPSANCWPKKPCKVSPLRSTV